MSSAPESVLSGPPDTDPGLSVSSGGRSGRSQTQVYGIIIGSLLMLYVLSIAPAARFVELRLGFYNNKGYEVQYIKPSGRRSYYYPVLAAFYRPVVAAYVAFPPVRAMLDGYLSLWGEKVVVYELDRYRRGLEGK